MGDSDDTDDDDTVIAVARGDKANQEAMIKLYRRLCANATAIPTVIAYALAIDECLDRYNRKYLLDSR